VSKDFGLWEMQNLDQMVKTLASSTRVALGLVTPEGRLFVAEHLGKPDKDPLSKVDAYICEKVLLQHTLKDLVDANTIIEYDHETHSVLEKMMTGKYSLAVILSPPDLGLIWTVAKAGEKMPKKSTFFFPKIWSGFVIYRMT
jgi:uncharacterized protein (DUF1015 family)